MVLSLALVAIDCAAGRVDAQQAPGASTPTLLDTSAFNDSTPPPGRLNAIPSRARRADAAARIAAYFSQAPTSPSEPLPAIQPLPGSGQQAQPPDRPTPARGATAPPRQTPAQPPAARNRQAAPRAASPDVEQQIQFDDNGSVTMHTNELDVRQLLELLSRRSRMNILVSPKVTGTITANFEGVTVEQVLNAIIKLANLVDRHEGTIHYIYSKDELQDDEEMVKKERIRTRVYKLNYVRADEILGIIRPFLSADVGRRRISVTPSYRFGISESATFVSGGGQAMSSGGSGGGGMGGGSSMGGPGGSPATGSGPTIGGYQPPTGGNSLSDFDHLIIQDYESNLEIIDQIIQRIDIRPVQVLIEAVIISVDHEHATQLGVNFGVVDNLGTALGTIGTGTALNGNVGFTPTKLLTTSGTIAQATTTDPLGFTSATNGAKFGFVANNVTGFIQALETIGSTKILASPRILVLNKQRAEIQLGSRLGFQTLSQNFTSTIQQVQFLNTGTLLRLRPFVSDDGMVRMEIHPERSSGTVTNNIPNQQTAELTTNVMVPDGATLVIGGLMEDEDDFQLQGLPGLSRLPVLGYLFGNRQKNEGRRELVVLLTPHIWSPDLEMAHAPTPPHGPGLADGAAPGSRTPPFLELSTGATDPALKTATSVASREVASELLQSSPTLAQAGTDSRPVVPSDPAAASRSPGSDQEASSSRRHRPWPSLRQWLSRRSPERTPDQPPGPGTRSNGPPQDPRGLNRVDGGEAAPAQGDLAPLASPQEGVPSTNDAPAIPEGVPSTNDAPAINPAGMSPLGAASPVRAARTDSMLSLARWEPEPTPSPARDQGAVRARAESPTTERSQPPGLRSGPVPAGTSQHTVAPGESFASIAWLYYGSESYGEVLWQFNRGRIARPDRLRVGDLLVVPPVGELISARVHRDRSPAVPTPYHDPADHANPVETAPSRSPGARVGWVDRPRGRNPGPIANDAARSAQKPAGAGRRPESPVHVVRRYETLRSIARDRLGDARRADEIRELNRDRLNDDDLLAPGLSLLLPSNARPQRSGP